MLVVVVVFAGMMLLKILLLLRLPRVVVTELVVSKINVMINLRKLLKKWCFTFSFRSCSIAVACAAAGVGTSFSTLLSLTIESFLTSSAGCGVGSLLLLDDLERVDEVSGCLSVSCDCTEAASSSKSSGIAGVRGSYELFQIKLLFLRYEFKIR